MQFRAFQTSALDRRVSFRFQSIWLLKREEKEEYGKFFISNYFYQTDAECETENLAIKISGSEFFAIFHQKLISIIKPKLVVKF
jgi:hypothetical protein